MDHFVSARERRLTRLPILVSPIRDGAAPDLDRGGPGGREGAAGQAVLMPFMVVKRRRRGGGAAQARVGTRTRLWVSRAASPADSRVRVAPHDRGSCRHNTSDRRVRDSTLTLLA